MPQAKKPTGRRTARGIIINDGHILLVERWRTTPKQGAEHYFAIPGGEIEPGETPEVAAVRECFEEASVVVRPSRLIATQKLSGDSESQYFLCEYLSGDLKLNPKSPEAVASNAPANRYFPQWIDIARLGTLPLHKGYEPLRQLLKDILDNKIPTKPVTIKSTSIKVL